jgi:hypothetical protein
MPTGSLNYLSPALASVGGGDESTYFDLDISPSDLAHGTNTIAVEVHQFSGTSSDISFDLELFAEHDLDGGTNMTVAIDQDIQIKARAFDGSWSALTEASFILEGREPASATNLVLCEVHYNPDGDDDAEFLEFVNISTNTLDLSGVIISNAFDFVFAPGTGLKPGAYLVLTRNAGAFESRYQETNSPYFVADVLVGGQWTPSIGLDNDSDRITLIATNGSTIVNFRYSDSGLWPGRADGDGSSLELIDPTNLPTTAPLREAYLENPQNWRPSCAYHGSPGTDDACTDILLSELLTHSNIGVDWIELHNPATQPVNVGGWFISDTYTNLTRYMIPANTIVPAGGYLVIEEGDLGFAFSERGEQATVSVFSGTNLTTFVERMDFGAAAQDTTFGRYVRSDGEVEYPALRFPTRLNPNAYPLVGPIVISEVMYHPTNGLEYIELANISDSTVALYDELHPTNTWRFTSAIDFTFPTHQSVDAFGVILITATNPAVFRASMGIPANIPVYGPWDGALNNAGESLKLRIPGAPELDGSVPYILVDKLEYQSAPPWVLEPDGTGPALERIQLYEYGNDPINWRSSVPGGTPGLITGALGHPYFQTLPFEEAEGIVRFSAIPGQRYRIEATTDLRSGDWDVLAIFTATDHAAAFTDPAPGKRKVYRVAWIP